MPPSAASPVGSGQRWPLLSGSRQVPPCSGPFADAGVASNPPHRDGAQPFLKDIRLDSSRPVRFLPSLHEDPGWLQDRERDLDEPLDLGVPPMADQNRGHNEN